ncbi:hypothetical protein E3C22_03195 [Jiella endophytica]|uniref:Uncharacterized protein n=1 Tax=Jiella endophytica TaxID=2558362 RepID=A0A4Y8RT42_9HYPH|nr:hypothetical protein [Jiella endophytica]TFF27479.1 hypothetical protein E3C22_03195 [Jiella endophytica]
MTRPCRKARQSERGRASGAVRCERIVDGEATDAFFRGEGERLRQLWIAGWEVNQPAADRA